MKHFKTWLLLICGLWLAVASAVAQNTNGARRSININKIYGPTNATMKSIAEIKVPAGFLFLDAESAKKLMQMEGEQVSGREMGYLRPTNSQWAVWFLFDDIGYVKDDDKDKLDPDALLKSIKAGNDRANEYRKEHGVPVLKVIGWEIQPKYNVETHNLEWAIRGESEGQPILNYNTRLLGRGGAMEVILVVEPDQLSATLPEYQTLLAGYNYQPGQRYAEYTKGDKIAKYGLAALITGGAAVVAVKTGLFAWLLLKFKVLWKFIVIGVVAVVGFFKRLITGDRSNKPSA